jgi:hypothetical protein
MLGACDVVAWNCFAQGVSDAVEWKSIRQEDGIGALSLALCRPHEFCQCHLRLRRPPHRVSKYAPAEPEALRSLAPSKGPFRNR